MHILHRRFCDRSEKSTLNRAKIINKNFYPLLGHAESILFLQAPSCKSVTFVSFELKKKLQLTHPTNGRRTPYVTEISAHRNSREIFNSSPFAKKLVDCPLTKEGSRTIMDLAYRASYFFASHHKNIFELRHRTSKNIMT